MTTLAKRLLMGVQVDNITLPTDSPTHTDGTLATATYGLNSDGTSVATGYSPANWIDNVANAGNYEARCTLNSGTLSGGSGTGSWLALSSNRSWYVQRAAGEGVGLSQANITVEVRKIGTTTVLDSATVDIYAAIA